MLICGLQKLSLLDYPGKLAATIFTGGCNLRCPFCHNARLVLRPCEDGQLSEREVLAFLEKRRGLLDGVCITGGEPLLQSGLENFIEQVHGLGFLVKLDTNGTFPEKLGRLIRRGLVDYVAMDLKNTPEKYSETVGIPGFDSKPIFESAALLLRGEVPYEFRTTLVKPFHTPVDLEALCQTVAGAENYFLQNFEVSGDLVGFVSPEANLTLSGFSTEELEQFRDVIARSVRNAAVRN